jgi:outer membrane receptor protein involved in Fe transport
MLKYRRKHSATFNLLSTYRKLDLGVSLFLKSKILNIDDVFLNPLTRETILPGFYDYWTKNNKGYYLIDVQAGIPFANSYRVSFVVKNLTNTEYMGRPGDVQPHRNFSIRISGNF